MNRREALAKATITTADVTYGLLEPQAARAFVRKIKERTTLSNSIRTRMVRASSGSIDKVSVASRIIRKATENTDDGYRVGASFDTADYQTVKVRLPWEVTEDTLHENIEGEGFENTLVDEMTTQFALDLEDLEINGDTASGDPFVSINDGLLKLATVGNGAHVIDGALINGGNISKAHFFEAYRQFPHRLRAGLGGELRWLASPAQVTNWWESLTDRATAAGDAVLEGRVDAARGPLGIPFMGDGIPSMPDTVMLLTAPRNLVRIISWELRKRRVTGETDAQLAALDKRLYIYFLKHDFIVEEYDAVVRVNGLVA